MSLLGIDIGTTGCKAVAFDEEGNELAGAYREYALTHPRLGWSELSPLLVWRKVREVLRQTNAKLAGDPVQAMSISCQGEAVVPVSRTGKELYNFNVSFDNRTQPQCDWWRQRLGPEEIFRLTGLPLHPMATLNKIMWLKQNEPEIYAKAWKFLCVEDYIIYRLTGRAVTDYSLAGRTMAMDVVKRQWSNEMLGAAGVDEALLPELHPSGWAVGTVLPKVAADVGLPSGAVVATGGHDQPCGALGAGIVKPGLAMNATGTSDVICPAFDEPNRSPAMLESNFSCSPHTCENQYCSIGFNLTGGLLLRWYRDVLGSEESRRAKRSGRSAYEVIFEEMAAEPTDVFFLPHFVGAGTPYLDPFSRGAVLGLTIQTGKPQLARAAVDSVNYEMKLNIDRMEAAGIPIREVRAIGGGAKSSKWLQMKADVFGKPVVSLRASEAASLGTAILAGKAIGLFASARDGARQLVKTVRTYEPDAAQHCQYKEKYQKYLDIYKTLRQFNHNLASKGECS